MKVKKEKKERIIVRDNNIVVRFGLMKEGSGCWQLSTDWRIYDGLAERFFVYVRMDILGIQDQLESR